jgi:hypothetical protein
MLFSLTLWAFKYPWLKERAFEHGLVDECVCG